MIDRTIRSMYYVALTVFEEEKHTAIEICKIIESIAKKKSIQEGDVPEKDILKELVRRAKIRANRWPNRTARKE